MLLTRHVLLPSQGSARMLSLVGVTIILIVGLPTGALQLHGPLDLASLHLDKPEAQFIISRVKRAVTVRTIPFVDVHLHENRTQLGADAHERYMHSRVGLLCGQGLYYRHTLLPGYEVDVHPFAHQDYESFNTNWHQESSITLTQTTATTEDTSVEWRVDSSVTESRQDTTTETSEESLGGSSEKATSSSLQNTTNHLQGLKSGIDFYGFELETTAQETYSYMNTGVYSAKDLHSNNEKSTESFTLSDALRSTTTSGQNSNRGNSKTFTQDVSLSMTCSARHLCEVQTWTFTAKVRGHCVLVPFFDFSRCPVQDGLAKARHYNPGHSRVRYEMFPPLNITLGAVNMSFPNHWFESVRDMFMTVPRVSDKHRSHKMGDGIVYPASNVKFNYTRIAPCEVSFPLLQSDGTPYSVQILFQEEIPSARRRRFAVQGNGKGMKMSILDSNIP
ncbi:hypothetical protein XA68_10410 [Ophiocordyceps unilateralis]|uniref:Uncharacterized protein n=1 Tax=Ophiocordyceps unilateralis TaxID=268505 RepID=A0A2A9PNQ9_OPHUN|nr:hypothetical protein XA68_10410 [Ophiocordyceps unilateralis]